MDTLDSMRQFADSSGRVVGFGFWVSVFEFWVLGFWVFGFLGFWVFGFLGFWVFGCVGKSLDIRAWHFTGRGIRG